MMSVLSGLCAHAGIQGKRTNHAMKATCATRLFQQGFNEQLICETFGNSSEAVHAYKRTNLEQKYAIS